MADITPEIETVENRFMRAWVQGDMAALKGLTARRFNLVIGSKPAVMLDRASWLEAANKRFFCSGYRFGDIYVRRHGSLALFASQLELKARMDGDDWSGQFWVTDLWTKGRVRRRWQLLERMISRVEEDAKAPKAIKSMQLWR